MPVSLTEAVTALNTTLHGLHPPPADLVLAPEIFINPIHSQFAGIGGVVEIRTEAPAGEVTALRVMAEAVVRVKAPSAAQLAAAETNVTMSLLGADPVNLRSNGVFRIRRLVDRDDQQVADSPD